MPASPGEPARRRSRRDQPREWTGLDTAAGFERCVRATLRELYGYVALLTGRDRREAERLVTGVYRSLFQAVQAGHIDAVTLGALRSAGRRTWLDAHRDQLAAIDEVSMAPASTIADLSMLERAVLVLRYVNGMTVDRAAAELGRSERDVSVLSAHAVRRLRGTDDTSGTWLRAYLGPSVTPSGGLVDRIVRQLGDAVSDQTPDEVVPDEVASDEVVPDEVAPDEVASDEVAPDEVVPDEVASDEVVPDEVVPDEVASDEVAPDELPTSELAIVDRPTVEIPSIERVAPPDAEDAPDGGPVAASPRPADHDTADHDTAEPRRPRWVVAVGALLVVALIVALVWLVLRGDTADTAESTTSLDEDVATVSGSTATTAPTPAAAGPATTEPVATEASGPVGVGLDPDCVERAGDEPTTVDWPTTFGALADAAALELTLPESVDDEADPSRAPARASVIVRPDGVIVAARPAAAHRPVATMVSRVGLDGTVAWVRCLDGDVVVASRPDAGVELAVRGSDATWTALALTDGSIGDELDAVQSAILDAPAAAADSDGLTLGSSYDSELGQTVPAVLDGGRVVWTASDVILPEPGSFRAAVVGEVVVVQSCVAGDDGPDCAAGELRGYDLTSGELLWVRPGSYQVVAVGGALALVGDDTGWQLVDVTTGDTVDGQRWDDPDTFAGAGEDADPDVSFVEQQNGAIVVARPGAVSVWLPADVDVTPAAVALP